MNNQIPSEAIKLFEEVRAKRLLLEDVDDQADNRTIESNRIIYLSLINALTEHADLSTSESTVEQIPASFLVHPHIRNALIHMWVSPVGVSISFITPSHRIDLGQSWICGQSGGAVLQHAAT